MVNTKEIFIYDIARTLEVSPDIIICGLRNDTMISKTKKKGIAELVEQMGYRVNPFAKNLGCQFQTTFPSLASTTLNNVNNIYQTNTIVVRSELILRDSLQKERNV